MTTVNELRQDLKTLIEINETEFMLKHDRHESLEFLINPNGELAKEKLMEEIKNWFSVFNWDFKNGLMPEEALKIKEKYNF